MNIFYGVVAAILLVIIIFQGRNLIPRVFSFLMPGDRNLYFKDLSDSPGSPERDEMIRPVIEKLESLGFTRLGIMAEKAPLWGRESREISLASAADKIIASVGFRRNKPSYFLYTPFTGGEVVITAYNSFRDFFKDDFATAVVASGDLDEMMEVHKIQVQHFLEKGRTPFQDYSRDSVIKATNLYYSSPYPRRQLRIAGVINLLFFLVLVFLFVISARAAFF